MTAPPKSWQQVAAPLHNSSQVVQNGNGELPGAGAGSPPRSSPVLPPPLARPPTSVGAYGMPSLPPPISSPYTSYMQPFTSGFNSYGYGGGSYGGGGYGLSPFRNTPYGGGAYGGVGYDDAERRFIQYAEERSRHTFANIESIVRVFNSVSMMLDNTFFAMSSSFRAVLSVADNFGRLRQMFGHIWYSVNLYRLFHYLYRKLMWLLGRPVQSPTVAAAWRQANQHGALGSTTTASPLSATSTWPTLAFLAMIFGAPYIISKFLPRYEDRRDPSTWQTPGVPAKAAFDFNARSNQELSLRTNDLITLAPTTVQQEMNLVNTGWAFAALNHNDGSGGTGLVPLSYLVIVKNQPQALSQVESNNNQVVQGQLEGPTTTLPASAGTMAPPRNHTKKVSFGETQIFENVDLEDYVTGKKNVLLRGDTVKKTAPNGEVISTMTTTTDARNNKTNYISNGNEELCTVNT